MTEALNDHAWHLDKRVPLGILLALAMQTVTLVAVASSWRASTDARLAALEKNIDDHVILRRRQWDSIKANTASNQSLDAKLAGLDERTKSIAAQTDRILGLMLAQIEDVRE